MPFKVLSKQAQIYFAIRIALQDILLRVSTLGHMMRDFYSDHPGQSCHDGQLTQSAGSAFIEPAQAFRRN